MSPTGTGDNDAPALPGDDDQPAPLEDDPPPAPPTGPTLENASVTPTVSIAARGTSTGDALEGDGGLAWGAGGRTGAGGGGLSCFAGFSYWTIDY